MLLPYPSPTPLHSPPISTPRRVMVPPPAPLLPEPPPAQPHRQVRPLRGLPPVLRPHVLQQPVDAPRDDGRRLARIAARVSEAQPVRAAQRQDQPVRRRGLGDAEDGTARVDDAEVEGVRGGGVCRREGGVGGQRCVRVVVVPRRAVGDGDGPLLLADHRVALVAREEVVGGGLLGAAERVRLGEQVEDGGDDAGRGGLGRDLQARQGRVREEQRDGEVGDVAVLEGALAAVGRGEGEAVVADEDDERLVERADVVEHAEDAVEVLVLVLDRVEVVVELVLGLVALAAQVALLFAPRFRRREGVVRRAGQVRHEEAALLLLGGGEEVAHVGQRFRLRVAEVVGLGLLGRVVLRRRVGQCRLEDLGAEADLVVERVLRVELVGDGLHHGRVPRPGEEVFLVEGLDKIRGCGVVGLGLIEEIHDLRQAGLVNPTLDFLCEVYRQSLHSAQASQQTLQRESTSGDGSLHVDSTPAILEF